MGIRRFILSILTIFALQVSWGVITGYCEHETGRAAQHFGHHSSDVQKLAGDAPDKSSGSAKKVVVHSHCASCSHGTIALNGLPVAVAMALPVRLVPLASLRQYSSSYSARPERPQWIVAV